MKEKCGVARDLMPLVLDDVSSDASKELVLGHVRNCSECMIYFDQLKRDVPAKTAQEIESEHRVFAKATAKLRKQKRLRTLKHVLAGVLIACVILLGGALGYDRLSIVTRQIGLDEYQIMLSQLQDGSVVVTADYKGSMVYLGTTMQSVVEVDEMTGEPISVLYVGMEKYWFAKKRPYPMQNASTARMSREGLSSYAMIRQGTPENSVALWKTGEPIPTASEEMEQYYGWIEVMERFEDRVSEENGGRDGHIDVEDINRESLMHTQWEALRAVVPEWQPWVGEQVAPLKEDTIRWMLEKDDVQIPGT